MERSGSSLRARRAARRRRKPTRCQSNSIQHAASCSAWPRAQRGLATTHLAVRAAGSAVQFIVSGMSEARLRPHARRGGGLHGIRSGHRPGRGAARLLSALLWALDLFKVTAARTRVFKARSFIFSPSWKSMARLVFPSRLELKRPEGSFRAAPLAKVIFTTFL